MMSLLECWSLGRLSSSSSRLSGCPCCSDSPVAVANLPGSTDKGVTHEAPHMPKKGRGGGGRGGKGGRGKQGRGRGGGGGGWKTRSRMAHDESAEAAEDSRRPWLSDGSDDDSSDGEAPTTLGVKLGMWEMNQNDVRRDTGSKLCRFGMARKLRMNEHWGGIILSPAATSVVSRDDHELIARYGCGVVNCSWAKLDDVPFTKLRSGGDRLLPYMFAANPTKYGQACVLSSCEALAAALYVAGFPDDARLVMEKFKWGASFWQLNGEYLDRYAACANSAEVIQVQEEVIAMIESERVASLAAKQGKDREYGGNWGIPTSSEEETEESEEEQPEQPEVSDRHCSSYAVQQANALRAQRLQQLDTPPPIGAGPVGTEEQGQAEAGGTNGDKAEVDDDAAAGWRDEAFGSTPKILCPSLLHATTSSDTGGEDSPQQRGGELMVATPPQYPAPTPVPQAYEAPSVGLLGSEGVAGGESEAVREALKTGLVFDDSWMEETCSPAMGQVGEYKEDDDVLEQLHKVAEREEGLEC